MAGSTDVKQLINDINKMKGVIPRELNKTFRAAVRPVADTARRNASWSSRIPGAISAASSRARRNPGAAIKVSKVVPHGRLYEFGANGKTFRHKVYGHERWVVEQVRPYIQPAVASHSEDFADACDKAVITAAQAAGFR